MAKLRMFLSGDVMLGRGIDQIFAHPSNPQLYENYVRSAKDYVALAEAVNGCIPAPVECDYVWGDAAVALARWAPSVRIVNLETSITTCGHPAPKGINYRMHPANVACLQAMRIDCCALANNHVLDWSRQGLLETLDSLGSARIAYAGAGRTRAEAESPAILMPPGLPRVLVFAFGLGTSGIPASWAAGPASPGVNRIDPVSSETIAHIARQVGFWRHPGDILVASLHWGGNWGYHISEDERRLAHGLIDLAGFDVIHGHSSHHPKGIEIYRNKLILYGCGDFLNDYEGISGQESYRGDLALAYLAECSPASGDLSALTLIAFQIRKFRLHKATEADRTWMCRTLDRESGPLGTRITLGDADALQARWQ